MIQSQVKGYCVKTSIHLALWSILLIAATYSLNGQPPSSITFSPSISILNFGGPYYCYEGGTVTVDPLGGTTRFNVELLGMADGSGPAEFTYKGDIGYVCTITLPLSLTLTSSGHTMIVDSFTSDPSGSVTLGAIPQPLKVGATLHIGAFQEAGTYTSSEFEVTLNFH